MASKFTTFIESFVAGETSPLIRGRIDTKLTSRGCRRLENFYVIPQGGIRRREGTKFVASTKDSTKKSILKPFVLDSGETRILEIGDNYIRNFSSGNTEDGSVPDAAGDGAGGGSASGVPGQQLSSPWSNSYFRDNITSWTVSATSGPSYTITHSALYEGSAFLDLPAHPTLFDQIQLEQGFGSLPAGVYTLKITSAGLNANNHFINIGDGSPDPVDIIESFSLTNPTSTLVEDEFTFTTNGVTDGYIVIWAAGSSSQDLELYISSIVMEAEPEEISTSINDTDLQDLGFTQGNGGMYITSLNLPPYKLEYDVNGLSIAEFVATDGPYFDKEHELYGGIGSGITVTTAGGAAGATGVTVTFSAPVLSTGPSEVGRLIRIRPNDSSVWGNCKITSVTSATVCLVTINSAIANTTTSTEWRLGSWSIKTGYPRASAFHEQRLVFGGTITQPQTIWGSYAGDGVFTNFAPDDGSADENVTDLTAYTFELATKQPELIQWLISKEQLLVGTNTQIHKVYASNFGELLSPLNVNVQSILKYGSARMDPILAMDNVIFSQLYRRQLLEMYYDTGRGRQAAKDLMVTADHLSDNNPIICSGYQQFPYGLFYFGTDDGRLLGLTYREDIGIQAWHTHFLGGNFGGDYPVIESITQSKGDVQDDIWMIVKRTINGATKRTVEMISDAATTNVSRTDAIYLDAHVRATVTADAADSNKLKFVVSDVGIEDGYGTTSTPALFSHLEGQTVGVVKNGVYLGTDTITSGQPVLYPATALAAADDVVIGLKYTSTAETNNIEPITNVGSAPGYDMRMYEINARLHNSLKGTIGYDAATSDDFDYPSSIDPTSAASATFTGDIKVKFPHGWDRENRIFIQQTEPYPLTVSLLAIKMLTGNA